MKVGEVNVGGYGGWIPASAGMTGAKANGARTNVVDGEVTRC